MKIEELVSQRLRKFVLFTLATLLVCSFAEAGDVCSGTTSPADCVIAQRFRPYFKMSMGSGSDDEPYHPANWQWIVGNSTFRQGSSTLVLPNGWSSDFHELLNNGGDIRSNPNDPNLHLDVNQYAHVGEPWSSVIHQGHGIYAHLEHIVDANNNNTQINIEYTIVWPYNEPPSVPSQSHDGDVTTLVVLYDQKADLISRVSYSAHGCILQVYQTRGAQKASIAELAGSDEHLNPTETSVAQISIDDNDAAHVVKNPCHGVTTSESHIFLAEDPDTHIYQHPVVYVEIGGHEFWPNASGFLAAAGGHDGKGVSFVPDSVQFLGTITNPEPTHKSFIFYSGLFGTDPHAIALHRTWCWPNACVQLSNPFGLQADRFTDPDPYTTLDSMKWPPSGFSAASPDVYVTYPQAGANPGTGTKSDPIPGFALAYSVAPSGSVLHVAPGPSGRPMTLRRPMTILANGGAVLIGGLN